MCSLNPSTACLYISAGPPTHAPAGCRLRHPMLQQQQQRQQGRHPGHAVARVAGSQQLAVQPLQRPGYVKPVQHLQKHEAGVGERQAVRRHSALAAGRTPRYCL